MLTCGLYLSASEPPVCCLEKKDADWDEFVEEVIRGMSAGFFTYLKNLSISCFHRAMFSLQPFLLLLIITFYYEFSQP